MNRSSFAAKELSAGFPTPEKGDHRSVHESARLVRIMSRAILSVSAYDRAIIGYCREYFDEHGIEDNVFRHDVASRLRGHLALGFLWMVYLESKHFRENYGVSSDRGAESKTEPEVKHTTGYYSKFVAELRSARSDLEESAGNIDSAVSQQVRLMARKASEVGLIEYVYVTKVKVLIYGTESLHEFFQNWLLPELDQV